MDAVDAAVLHLRAARDLLRCANAPKSLQRVRLALSSAEGAVRNASCRVSKAARQEGLPGALSDPS